MRKFSLFLILISLMGSFSWAHTIQKKKWAQTIETGKESVTKLEFYFHDILSGKNPTAMKVIQAKEAENSPTLFSTIVMTDDPLTEKPELSSKLVGRAQGLYGLAGQQAINVIMVMSFAFLDGVYNGSSISVFGRNSAEHPVREIPIVGGSGVFRMARGYALAYTYSYDPPTGDAIVGYNVTIIH